MLRRVIGDSMAPSLLPGTVVFGLRLRSLRAGDVVIVRHQGIDKIKRVQKICENQIFLVGDNLSSSTDSRHFGWLNKDSIRARVIWPNSVRTRS